MEILFLILKIIGILLAVCVLLLVAALVVPVRYRVKAELYQDMAGFAVFSWLLHVIDFRIRYEKKEVVYRLRIFGIPVRTQKSGTPKRDKEKKEISEKEEIAEENITPEEDSTSQEKEIPEEDNTSQEKEIPEENVLSETGALSEEKASDNRSGVERSNRKDKRRVKARRKKRGLLYRIRAFFRTIRQRISDIIAGTATIKEKNQNIKNIISDETNKSAVGKLWREFRFLIRHISPRKVSGELAFGMNDPAQTGQVLGVMSMLPFWARYKINVYPNFETDRFFVEGNLLVKGHIRLWHLLLSFIRLFKDKEVKSVWRKIRT